MTARPVDRLRDFWNQRYAAEEFAYVTAPDDFLVAIAARCPPAAKFLCIADGEGCNSVWLATRACDVSEVDIADCGMQKAARFAAEQGVDLHTEVADLTNYDFCVAQWGIIVSIFLHLPPYVRIDLHRRCLAALKPGGLIVFEAYAPRQLGHGTDRFHSGVGDEVQLLVKNVKNMNFDSLDHLVLTVQDVAISIDYYVRVLGIEAVSFGTGRRALIFGRQKFNLHPTARRSSPMRRRRCSARPDRSSRSISSIRTGI